MKVHGSCSARARFAPAAVFAVLIGASFLQADERIGLRSTGIDEKNNGPVSTTGLRPSLGSHFERDGFAPQGRYGGHQSTFTSEAGAGRTATSGPREVASGSASTGFPLATAQTLPPDTDKNLLMISSIRSQIFFDAQGQLLPYQVNATLFVNMLQYGPSTRVLIDASTVQPAEQPNITPDLEIILEMFGGVSDAETRLAPLPLLSDSDLEDVDLLVLLIVHPIYFYEPSELQAIHDWIRVEGRRLVIISDPCCSNVSLVVANDALQAIGANSRFDTGFYTDVQQEPMFHHTLAIFDDPPFSDGVSALYYFLPGHIILGAGATETVRVGICLAGQVSVHGPPPILTACQPAEGPPVPVTLARYVVSEKLPTIPPPPPAAEYVALGDSYSSGEGVPPYFNDSNHSGNRCHRSTRAYSAFVELPGDPTPIHEHALAGEPGFAWDFLACSGATTRNVWAECQRPDPKSSECYEAPDDLPQLQRGVLDQNTDLVTITIGGNDAGFRNVLMHCIWHLDCQSDEFLPGWTWESWLQNLIDDPNDPDAIRSLLRKTFQELKLLAPNAAIFALGYPHLMNGSLCFKVAFLISPSEQAFFNDATDRMSQAIADVAAEVGIHYVDVRGHFADHEVCGAGEDWIRGIALPFLDGRSFNGLKATLHPTRQGQEEYAAALASYDPCQARPELCSGGSWGPGYAANGLPRNPPAAPPAAAPAAAQAAAPLPTVGDLFVEPATPPPCPTDNVYVPAQSIRIAGLGFAPGAAVSLEFTSAGGYTAAVGPPSLSADGSGELDAVVSLPIDILAPSPALVEAKGTGENGQGRLLMAQIGVAPSITADSDADGTVDLCDNCPFTPGPSQLDADGDGVGDLCDAVASDFEDNSYDPSLDSDADGVADGTDNCPVDANPAQADTDGDGIGDVCDQGMDWDVAPFVPAAASGSEVCPGGGNGVESGDALAVLKMAVYLITGFSCYGVPIDKLARVDVAPATAIDYSTTPPTVTAGGDGGITAADALFILRHAVGLIDLVPAGQP